MRSRAPNACGRDQAAHPLHDQRGREVTAQVALPRRRASPRAIRWVRHATDYRSCTQDGPGSRCDAKRPFRILRARGMLGTPSIVGKPDRDTSAIGVIVGSSIRRRSPICGWVSSTASVTQQAPRQRCVVRTTGRPSADCQRSTIGLAAPESGRQTASPPRVSARHQPCCACSAPRSAATTSRARHAVPAAARASASTPTNASGSASPRRRVTASLPRCAARRRAPRRATGRPRRRAPRPSRARHRCS